MEKSKCEWLLLIPSVSSQIAHALRMEEVTMQCHVFLFT
jgi:hypothetical protein